MDTQGSEDAPRSAAPTSVVALGAKAVDGEAARHFDACETHFFQQGDESDVLGGDEAYDDSSYRKDRRHVLSYFSLVGVSLVSSALAVAASVALFRSNAPLAAPGVAMSAAKAAAPRVPVSRPSIAKDPAAGPLPQAASVPPAVAVGPAAQDPSGAAAAPTVLAGPVIAVPAAIIAPIAPPPAEESKAAKPAKAPGSKAEIAKGDEEKVTEEKVAEEKVAEAPAAVSLPLRGGDARERCRQSIRSKRSKEIVAACATAFAEDATFADAAVAVARVEFDRGRFAQASTWSRKAIAVNPESAEAYVFVGGAEQNRGHGKAAKEAYLQYLRLAPSGRYAAEIRTIVGSL